MKLIEDLGMQEYGTQGLKTRFGLYECPSCNERFERMTASITKNSPKSCTLCSRKIRAKSMVEAKVLIASEEFNDVCSRVHVGKYDYSLVEYTTSNNKVIIICPVHGEFLQSPSKHKSGQGCPGCAEYGFDKNKSAVLYYLKITTGDVTVYKIGVTNRSVQERFNNTDIEKIQVLKIWDFILGKDAYSKEQEVLRLHKESLYRGSSILSSGNSELFTIDVLGLDLVET